jgi:hypothetical protein
VSGGNVSGGGGTGTPQQGGTGSGQVGNGFVPDGPEVTPSRSDVFDPVHFSSSDEVRVRLDGSDPGEIVDQVEGTGLRNVPVTPYAQRYAEYQQAALEALTRSPVPADLEALIRDYFTSLEP